MSKSQTTRPDHWLKIEFPEDNGDPRLLDACWALMDVCAKPPAGERYIHDLPVLDLDPDLNDMPIDHTQGTDDDPITQVAVVRLAKAVLEIADRYAECRK
jgi:hypothetical protein